MADDSGVAPLALGNRCYVGNLAWATTTEALTEHFASHGALLSANVMRDDGGRSKGWGLVEYATPEQAAAAIELTNSTELEGRRLLVREDRGDKVKEDRPPRSGRGAGRGDRVGGGEGRGGRGGRGGDREPRGDREHREPRAERAPRPERVENSSGLQVRGPTTVSTAQGTALTCADEAAPRTHPRPPQAPTTA
ncbi:hypothetical protein FOA52_000388 [Chlamydomonas sp. UWO 241]|nr:hypothetical protein FOA52_000388 [Chlamydomonas sp. UWO 241]